jgi:parvulin-like peptidyl-prolyl isomerase
MLPNRTISALMLAASLCVFAAHAADKTLVSNKDVKVTDDDFLAYMERVPVEMRLEAMADGERNNKVVDLIFTNRMLAIEARKSGLAQDPAMARRAEQAVEAFLAQQYSLWLEKNAKLPDLEGRAYELYLANPRKYTEPERVELQHILVSTDGRTKEMARARANEIRAKALAGEDFLKLAEANSDDPGFKRDAGRLGFVAAADIDHRLAAVAFKMKADGELSEPIETNSGYHLIKRTGYKASYKRKYEEVKDDIIEEQKAKVRGDASAKHVDAIRRSPETVWNAPAIASLRTEVPREELQRKQREEMEKLEKQKAAPQGASQDLGQAGAKGKN